MQALAIIRTAVISMLVIAIPAWSGLALAQSAALQPPGSTGMTASMLIPVVATCPGGNGLFVLYYGDVQNPASGDSIVQTIVSGQPNFTIFGDGLQARSDIPTYLHGSGLRALMYIPMNYGSPIFDIDARIDIAMQSGYDGIFFDETSTSSS